MQPTHPEVHLLASPQIHWDAMAKYLAGIGGSKWFERISEQFNRGELTETEILTEFMARGCYRSFDVGLNPNVTKVREDSRAYFTNVLQSGHGSVLEHAQFSFYFSNVSRVFTHELVRHRAGVAISQESLRYVRLTDLGFRIPEILKDRKMSFRGEELPSETVIVELVERLEDFQKSAAEAFGLDNEGVPFHYKKEVTSALRRLAPIGLSTNIGWSANIRTLRFVIEKRTEAGAEEEIRLVFDAVARVMRQECPMLFADFAPVTVDGSDIPAWVPAFKKV